MSVDVRARAVPAQRPDLPAGGTGRRWDTPGRLRAALAAAVVAGLLLAGPGLLGLVMRADTVERARDEAAHLVTVQNARTRLLTADALATTTVLLGPDATANQSAHYRYAVQEVPLRLAVGAATPEDRYALASAAGEVQEYAREVAQAQQLAMGGAPDAAAERLRQAQRTSRSEALSRLEQVGLASRARLTGDLDAAENARLLVVVVVALTLVVLALVQLWLARRTRRVLNVALLAGTLAAAAAAAVALVALQGSAAAAEAARGRTAPVVDDLVTARTALFDAMATEGVALLRRAPDTTPARLEQQWNDDVARVQAALGRLPGEDRATLGARDQGLLGAYVTAHASVHRALAGGHRRAALQAASDPSDTGSAGASENLDIATSALLTRQVRHLDEDLAAAGAWLRLVGWCCVAGGGAAAVLGWRGIGRRLAEYH